MDLDQINIEIAVFLKRLRMFSDQSNVQINEKTTEMLLDIVVNIDKLIANAEMIPTTGADNVDFVFDLNEKHFDLRHYIMCRLCIEQIGVSKEDLDSHLQRKIQAHKEQSVADVKQESPTPGFDAGDSNMDSGNNSGCTDESTSSNKKNETNTTSSNDFTRADERPDVQEQAQCNGDQPINHNNYAKYLIRASGIPWVATKMEVVQFFGANKIVNGVDGVHFIIDKVKNSRNDAFIQLVSEKERQVALSRKCKPMSNSLIKFTQPDAVDFKKLFDKPSYPFEQRVLRLESLPENCTAEEVRKYFEGRSIAQVNFALDQTKRSMVFVTFHNVADVEWALEQIDGKRIRKTLLKVYRSSEEQLQHYCNANATASNFKKVPDVSTIPGAMTPFLGMANPFNMNSVPDLVALSPMNKAKLHSSTISLSPDSGLHEIVARGFPWRVTQADVRGFFANVSIVGGIDGISIRRNNAMEALFYVNSKEDARKAMANDKKLLDSRVIYVLHRSLLPLAPQMKPNLTWKAK